MSSPTVVDIFVEDQAHRDFLVPVLRRLAAEEDVPTIHRVRSAVGGHGRALSELKLYQRLAKDLTPDLPQLLIVCIDANCSSFAKARKAIKDATGGPFSDRLVVACPDPHVERWYVADPESFKEVVGRTPRVGRKKCVRDYYKNVLARTVRQAGHPVTLGGIEFAQEIVEQMDFYRAGRNDRSLKSFLDGLRNRLRLLRSTEPPQKR